MWGDEEDWYSEGEYFRNLERAQVAPARLPARAPYRLPAYSPSSIPSCIILPRSATMPAPKPARKSVPRAAIEPGASSLDHAIASTSVEVLRQTLSAICEVNEDARQLAEKKLLLATPSGDKHKAYEQCRNCDIEFEVMHNSKGDCIHHRGEKVVNYQSETWADHNDDPW